MSAVYLTATRVKKIFFFFNARNFFLKIIINICITLDRARYNGQTLFIAQKYKFFSHDFKSSQRQNTSPVMCNEISIGEFLPVRYEH
jgi:hypothetical protein